MPSAKPSHSGPAWKQRSGAGRSFPVVPVAIGVVLLLALIAVLASRGSEDEIDTSGLQQTAPVELTGDPLPPLARGDDPAVGMPAPEVAGESFDGTPVAITDDGRPKLLVFLAHWCPHCQAEVPKILDWLEANGAPAGVEVYGVATATNEDRPNHPPSRWLDREGWALPTLADTAEGEVAEAFGLSAFPFFVVIDEDHQVVQRGSGELSAEQWEALLESARA